jgi:hypothetical protein
VATVATGVEAATEEIAWSGDASEGPSFESAEGVTVDTLAVTTAPDAAASAWTAVGSGADTVATTEEAV